MTIPRDIKAKRPQFFSEEGVDALLSAFTQLLTEHWVLRERIFVIEALAEDKQLFSRADLEDYSLSESQQTELAQARNDLLERVFINIRVSEADPAQSDER